MPSLSVVMIVKNEVHCLGDCLNSVRGIADEIVIGDTGSTDGTVELAVSHGAKIIEVPWRDDFAAARNEALKNCRGDWLLHMDADEELDQESAQTIRRLVKQDGAGLDAFEVMLYNYCDDVRAWRWMPVPPRSPLEHFARGHAGYLPVPLLRLFRNRRGFVYREAVHENITDSVRERGGQVGSCEAIIHHHGYAATGTRQREKAARYLAIARKKAEENPANLKALHDFAEQATACDLGAEAEAACRQALAIDPLDVPTATTLANHLLNRGAFAEARAVLERFEQLPEPPAHLLMALGALEIREGRLDLARARLEAASRANPKSAMARLYLARVYDQLGEITRAENELKLAAECAPTIPEFRDRLRAHVMRREGERLFQTGFPGEAFEVLVEALRMDAEDPLLHNDIGVLMHHLGEVERARESFERAITLAPALSEARKNLVALR